MPHRVFRFFAGLFNDGKACVSALPRTPEGVRVYAIGDVHGRVDLLRRLHALIEADNGRRPAAETVLVYLGDYIDRGPASREVVEFVMQNPPWATRVVRLRGNHEEALLTFIDDPQRMRAWLDYGGLATLHSYGVRMPSSVTPEQRLVMMGEGLREALPTSHTDFFRGLSFQESLGDYLFVHAGVNPELPLDQQSPSDLLDIRSPFLEWGRPLAKVVVHGHTISQRPEFLPWRIGIDTGAYATGRLTCLVLDGDEQATLATESRSGP